MKKVDLYEIDEFLSYFKGLKNFKNYSQYFTLVALMPTGNGKFKTIQDSMIARIIDAKYGFNNSRRAIQSMMPGCDMYYKIEVRPETAKIRRDLNLSKVSLNVDEDGLAEIEEKRYFVLYPLVNLSKEDIKKVKALNLDPIAKVLVSDEDGYSLKFTEQVDINDSTGYLLKVSDIKKILEQGLEDLLLSEGQFAAFIQKGSRFEKVSLEEALDSTIIYNPGDDIELSRPSSLAGKIEIYYEYDPLYEEQPNFGEIYELIHDGANMNGEPTWRKSPKIVQNEYYSQYALRAKDKGVRTVSKIPDNEVNEILTRLEKEGKLNKVIEFVHQNVDGKDVLVERPRTIVLGSENDFRV